MHLLQYRVEALWIYVWNLFSYILLKIVESVYNKIAISSFLFLKRRSVWEYTYEMTFLYKLRAFRNQNFQRTHVYISVQITRFQS
jgi:hypothetical protein